MITVKIEDHSEVVVENTTDAMACLWAYGTLTPPESARFRDRHGEVTNEKIIKDRLTLKDCKNVRVLWRATAMKRELQPWESAATADQAVENLLNFIAANRDHITCNSDDADHFEFLIDDAITWVIHHTE